MKYMIFALLLTASVSQAQLYQGPNAYQQQMLNLQEQQNLNQQMMLQQHQNDSLNQIIQQQQMQNQQNSFMNGFCKGYGC